MVENGKSDEISSDAKDNVNRWEGTMITAGTSQGCQRRVVSGALGLLALSVVASMPSFCGHRVFLSYSILSFHSAIRRRYGRVRFLVPSPSAFGVHTRNCTSFESALFDFFLHLSFSFRSSTK